MIKLKRKLSVAIAVLILTTITAVLLASCGSSSNSDDATGANTQATAQASSGQNTDAKEDRTPEPAAPLSLVGEWRQSNNTSETAYQTATITDSTIEIYWVNTEMDTESLYWAGSYTPATESTDTYTWDSANDTEKTSTALLASEDDTKKFSYSNGEISYKVTALGTTTTVKLAKQ